VAVRARGGNAGWDFKLKALTRTVSHVRSNP
jgi:hypothetical protein